MSDKQWPAGVPTPAEVIEGIDMMLKLGAMGAEVSLRSDTLEEWRACVAECAAQLERRGPR